MHLHTRGADGSQGQATALAARSRNLRGLDALLRAGRCTGRLAWESGAVGGQSAVSGCPCSRAQHELPHAQRVCDQHRWPARHRGFRGGQPRSVYPQHEPPAAVRIALPQRLQPGRYLAHTGQLHDCGRLLGADRTERVLVPPLPPHLPHHLRVLPLRSSGSQHGQCLGCPRLEVHRDGHVQQSRPVR